MNATLRYTWRVTAKQAVNAIMTNGALMALIPKTFHMHSLEGWSHIMELTGATILSRELMVWGPKILAWSTAPEPEPIADQNQSPATPAK